MVSKIRSRVALAVLIVGILFTLATVVLPVVKTHQRAVAAGPASPYGTTGSTLSGYLIPPVDKGVRISIVVTGYTPGSLSFSMFPTTVGSLAPSGQPLLILNNFTAPIERVSVVSSDTQAYGIYIVSSNRTQYVIAVDSYWSPYYQFTEYTAEGLFAILGGFFAFYYYRIWERKRTIEEKAKSDLAAHEGEKTPSGEISP